MSNGRPPGSSMAARCTACSTVFRVVPDQLRVSEGWVRCGRCAEVFNAAENLIDLDTGTPHRLGADGVLGLRTASTGSTGSTSRTRLELPTSVAAQLAPPMPPPPTRPSAPSASSPPSPPSPSRQSPPPAPSLAALSDASPHEHTQPFRREDADAARLEPLLSHEDTRPLSDNDDWAPLRASSAASPTAWAPAEPTVPPAAWAADDPSSATAAATAPLPSFVRSADRAARWRQPRVRAGMATAAVTLLLLLGWQAVFSQRDLAAARWPLAHAVLQPACAVLGCNLEAPRLIDSLAVESSGLLRVEKSDIYRLSVALRNRGTVDILLPALDITLTDPQGQLVARRVLRTGELGAADSTLAPGKELALQATLQASALPSTPGASATTVAGGGVAGYTIELFYP